LERSWLKTAGKTPEATMNAQLIVDINTKKEKSRFVKTAPSIFGLNEGIAVPEIKEVKKQKNLTKFQKMFLPNRKATSPKRESPSLSRFTATRLYLAINLFLTMKELI